MDVISETLGTATGVDRGADYKAMVSAMKTEVKTSAAENIESDYTFVRANLKSIIEKGMEAVDGLIDLAGETQSPRMYESASTFLKTLTEINESLLNVSEKRIETVGKASRVGTDLSQPTVVTNNAIFCGSNEELMSLITGRG